MRAAPMTHSCTQNSTSLPCELADPSAPKAALTTQQKSVERHLLSNVIPSFLRVDLTLMLMPTTLKQLPVYLALGFTQASVPACSLSLRSHIRVEQING